MRHLVTLSDLTSVEIERIFAITEDLKTKYKKGLREPLLPGRVMALLFEKQSLRTRVSFEAGMTHLGGGAMFLGEDVGFGRRESMSDFGRVLGEPELRECPQERRPASKLDHKLDERSRLRVAD